MSIRVSTVDTTVSVRVDNTTEKVTAKVYQGRPGATGPAGPNTVTSATTSDGTANLSLSNVSTATATVTGLLTASHIHGNLAGTLYTHVRTGEAMSKGDPFYISGFHAGSSQPIVMRADASNPAKMPAVGVMDADYAANTSSANGIISGTLSSVDTDGYSVNSPVYVANGGGYSNTAGTIPQQVGITERANVSTGAFIVTSNKVIASADISDATSTPTLDKIVKYTDYINPSINAYSFHANKSVVIGSPNTTDGQLRLFDNGPAIQWYSDTIALGERGYTFSPTNLTSEQVYLLPNASGTIALTSNTNGEPDKLTGGTISGTTTINSTSYIYGTGAAAAHRAALKVGEFISAVKSTSETRTSSTIAADSNLVLPLGANSLYRIKLYFSLQTVATGGTITCYFDYTGTLNDTSNGDTIGVYYGFSQGRMTWQTVSPARTPNFLAGNSATTPFAFEFTLIVKTNSSGDARFMWSNASGTGSMRVNMGSYITAEKLA